MKKRIMASLLTLCMVLTLLPSAALAAEESQEGETPVVCTKAGDCAAEVHEDDCPLYVVPATDPEPEPPMQQVDEPGHTEPTATELLQARITALPNTETLERMDKDDQSAVYVEVCAIYDAINALTGTEADGLDTSALEDVFSFFTRETMPLENMDASNMVLDFTSGDIVTSGSGWTWDNNSNTLTLSGATINGNIKLPADATIILADASENSIIIGSGTAAALDCAGNLTIKGETAGTGRLDVENKSTEGSGQDHRGNAMNVAATSEDIVLTIENCEVTVNGKNGILVTSAGNVSLNISKAVVSASITEGQTSGPRYAVNAYSSKGNADLSISNSRVTVTEATMYGLQCNASASAEIEVVDSQIEATTVAGADAVHAVGKTSSKISVSESDLQGKGNSNGIFAESSQGPAAVEITGGTIGIVGGDYGIYAKGTNDTSVSISGESIIDSIGARQTGLKAESLNGTAALSVDDTSTVTVGDGASDSRETATVNTLDFSATSAALFVKGNGLLAFTAGSSVLNVTISKDGSTFVGWYDNEALSGEKVAEFSENSIYYAKWTIKSPVTVSSEAELRNAILYASNDAENPTIIEVANNIELTSPLIIAGSDGTAAIHIKLIGSNGSATDYASNKKISASDSYNGSSSINFILVGTNGSLVTENITLDAGHKGRVVSVSELANFTMKEGTWITNGGNPDTSTKISGGGLYSWSANATITMDGGKISGCVSSGGGNGGAVTIGNTTNVFTMNAGTIQDNEGSYAGGIYIANGIAYLTGGSITNNIGTDTTHTYGGGAMIHPSAIIYIGGNINITGNKNSVGEASDVWLAVSDQSTLTLQNALTGAIGLAAAVRDFGDVLIKAEERYTITDSDLSCLFFNDAEKNALLYLDDNAIKQTEAITLTLNPNYGDEAVTTQKIRKGVKTNLPTNPFSRENHLFAGWNTESNCAGTNYVDKAAVTLTSDLTLYANWVSTITFNANGGSGEMAAQEIIESTPANLTANTFTRTGHTFSGWNTKADGTGDSYADQATAPSGNTTLYAQWTPNSYTISFSGGAGASGSTASVSATYDTPATLTANGFTKSGSNFAGWDTDSSADEVIYSDKAQVENLTAEANGTITLYAVWTDKSVLAPDLTVQIKAYSGATQAFTLEGNYTITYQQDSQPATPKDAGTYDVVISTTETETTAAYQNTVFGGLAITPAILTITANNQSIYVGGELPTGYSYTVTGLAGEDALTTEPTVACPTANASNIGTYPITASGADAGDNYTITYVNGTLTVADKDAPILAITASSTTLTGGGSVKLTVRGIPSGGAATVTQTDDQGSEAKTLDLTGNGDISVNLDNKDAKYTFTVSYAGDGGHAAATAICEVSVTRRNSSGGGSGSSGGSTTGGVSGSGDSVSVSTDGGTVSSSQMDAAVGKANEGATIEIKATGSAAATLPVSGMKDAAKNNNDVTVVTQNGEVTLSAAAIEGLTEGASSGQTIKVSVTTAAASAAGLDAGTPVFDVSVSVGNTAVHSFDGALTITLTVSGLSKIENPYVMHILNDGTKQYLKPAVSGSKLTVTGVRGLSYFAVIPGSEVPKALPFTDVDESAYYHDAVRWAYENDITGGTGETTFSPDAICTRAQAVTFLWRAAGSPAATGGNPFTDVDSGAYYYDAVLWAVEKGVTSGTSATTFSPNATCTRGQIVTFLYRYAGSPAVTAGVAFTDVASDAYYADAVAWAAAENITSGTSATTFTPDVDCTRGQIVTFLYRYMGK